MNAQANRMARRRVARYTPVPPVHFEDEVVANEDAPKKYKELRMTSRMPVPKPGSYRHQANTLKMEKPALFYTPDNAQTTGSLTFNLCLKYAAEAETDDLCGLFTGAILVIAPSLKGIFVSVLKYQGLVLDTVKVPSQCASRFVDTNLPIQLNPAQVLTLWGASILIVFKNVGPENYDAFMTKRMNAIRARVGGDPNEELSLPFDMRQAAKIRGIFGANDKLKRTVVEFIIENSLGSSALAQCCQHLMGLLAWSEMHPFKFMYDTLCVTGSKVLMDPRVQSEVEAVAEAYYEIVNLQYPAFFRFFATPDKLCLLERSRFPTLITVAVAIRSRDHKTLNNFVTPIEVTEPIITSLLKLHESDTRNPQPRVYSEAHKFLMKNFDFKFALEDGQQIEDATNAERVGDNQN